MLYDSDYFPEGGTIELNSSYTFSLTDIVGVGTDGKITVTVPEDATGNNPKSSARPIPNRSKMVRQYSLSRVLKRESIQSGHTAQLMTSIYQHVLSARSKSLKIIMGIDR